MADIGELRERVEAARKRFGLMDEQQQQYSERLVSLMDVVDDGIRQQRAHADDLQSEVDKLAHENDELKSMLQALLLAVEEDSSAGLASTMQMLESRATALVEATEASTALPPPASASADTVPAGQEAPTERESIEDLVDDVPVTPPTPWEEETGAGEAAARAGQADDDGGDGGASASAQDRDEEEEYASPDVEERVKRLIEMTGGSSSSG